jgi:hypothetical protein
MGDESDTLESNFLSSPPYTSAVATTAFRKNVCYVLLGLGLVVLLGTLLTIESIAAAVLTVIVTIGYVIGRAFFFAGATLRPEWEFLAMLTFFSVVMLHIFYVVRFRIVARIACDYSGSLPTPVIAEQAIQRAQRNYQGYAFAARAQIVLLVMSTFAGITANAAADNQLDGTVAGLSLAALYVVFAISWLARRNGYRWALDLPVQLTACQLIEATSGFQADTRRDSLWAWLESPEGQAWLSAMAETGFLDLRTDKGLETLVRGMALVLHLNVDPVRYRAKTVQQKWIESLPQPKMFGICSDAS